MLRPVQPWSKDDVGEARVVLRRDRPRLESSATYHLAAQARTDPAQRAARSQPRTVSGGRPSRPAIRRCPPPSAARCSASPIRSTPSRRRAARKAGSSTWVASQLRQQPRRRRSERSPSRMGTARDAVKPQRDNRPPQPGQASQPRAGPRRAERGIWATNAAFGVDEGRCPPRAWILDTRTHPRPCHTASAASKGQRVLERLPRGAASRDPTPKARITVLSANCAAIRVPVASVAAIVPVLNFASYRSRADVELRSTRPVDEVDASRVQIARALVVGDHQDGPGGP